MGPLPGRGRCRYTSAVAAFCALLPFLTAQSFGQSHEVRIVKIEPEGRAEVLAAGAQNWILTQTNQVLRTGDRLRTLRDGRVSLRWGDGSVVSFGPLTEIEILPPHEPNAQSGLQLFRGILSFFHREKPSRLRVITRGAIAGVDGTDFVVDVKPFENTERTTLYVVDGRVDFRNEQGGVIVTNGYQAVAEPGKQPVLIAGFVANNVLQWAFYYPAVLYLRDLPLAEQEQKALSTSLASYREGDLLKALAAYPADREPASEAERIYYAALVLSVGQVEKAEAALAGELTTDRFKRLTTALRQLIAAVKRQPNPATLPPDTATEFLAASYYEQSRAIGDVSLEKAREFARQAVTKAPDFGFAWARLAELEMSFGRNSAAINAAEKSLELSPRNAQALALKGFLLAAQNRPREAIEWFDKAIAVDPGLGNAWLGRGLARIRTGQSKLGQEDLLIAAALEPQRSLLRSYLGKAYGDRNDPKAAEHEFNLAREIDPKDPTPLLYSALLKAEQNRVNEAIDDLERSKELNDNRLLYRSRLLIDQDRAIRSANLARIYADAGLDEVAVREAARSVASDYGNYSGHYFLANSYNNLRRANPFDLRFETAAFGEYLLANLMGPAEGSLLAQPISQQEYTRLFQRDYLGFSSLTEYLSRGAWTELAVQYGTFGNASYALEGDYLWDPGQGPNASFEQKVASASFKQMLTPKTGLYVEAIYFSQDAEDIGAKYDPEATFKGVQTREKQEPTLLAGFDHQWNEANRTLFLASHINDSLRHVNPRGATYLLPEIFGNPVSDLVRTDLTQEYRNRLTVDSFELQHINRIARFQTIAGIRFQDSVHRITNLQTLEAENASDWQIYFGLPGDVITNQSLRLNALRISPYLYEHWEVVDSLWLIGGVSYDYQEQPGNLLFAPVSDEQEYKHQLSPKGAIVWTPTAHSAVRGAYTRSLGGVSLDQSVRLEPSQLAGFVQSYRDVIPPGVGIGIDATRIETADLSLEHRFPTRTYVAVGGQFLRSAVEHDVGVFERDISTSSGPGIQLEEKLRYQERSFDASVHQLIADWFSLGVRYRLSEARLKREFLDIDSDLAGNNNHRSRGVLNTVSIQNLFRHPSGFFAAGEAIWWSQELGGNLTALPEDELWHVNLFIGYRSPRRYVEVTVGLLNVGDEDYRIHPINLYAELPRERTFFTRLQVNF